jgi:hypothetical protein
MGVVFGVGLQEEEASGLILAAHASMVEEVADKGRERAADQSRDLRVDQPAPAGFHPSGRSVL